MTPEQALELLKAGNERFAAGTPMHRDLPAKIRETARGQFPFGAIVSCMDSRVPVELVFDLTVGEAFSIRVAGNVINEDILGSLEFATSVAGAKLILVLGHTRCGAVQGAIDGVKLGNLTSLLARIIPPGASRPAPGEEGVWAAHVTRRNAENSMRDIREKSPAVRALLESGAVRLAGGIYDVETGKVAFFDS
jgi:carbonic anhydrase